MAEAVSIPGATVALSTASVYPDTCASAFATAARLGYDAVEVMVWTDPVSQEAGALGSLVADLGGMTSHQRERLSGVSASRSRQLLAGALVAEAAMDLLGLERLEICPWALREGVILSRLDAMR